MNLTAAPMSPVRIGVRNRMAVESALEHLQGLTGINPSGELSLLLISPDRDDLQFARSRFPRARIFASFRWNWDLNRPCPFGADRFDLCLVSNVFHYSPDPALWYENLLATTRVALIQDLIWRKRSDSPPFLGPDGDAIRYEFNERGVHSAAERTFDLSMLDLQFRYFETFSGGLNDYHDATDPPRHFVSIVEGRRTSEWNATPLKRSDDWRLRRWNPFALNAKQVLRHLLASVRPGR